MPQNNSDNTFISLFIIRETVIIHGRDEKARYQLFTGGLIEGPHFCEQPLITLSAPRNGFRPHSSRILLKFVLNLSHVFVHFILVLEEKTVIG